MNSILHNLSLRNRLIEEGLLNVKICKPEENERFQALIEAGEPLPDGVCKAENSDYEFYRMPQSDLSAVEELTLVEALKLKELTTIRKWATSFVVVFVISLIICVLVLISD